MARIKLTKADVNKAFEEALSEQPKQAGSRPLLQQLKDRVQRPDLLKQLKEKAQGK